MSTPEREGGKGEAISPACILVDRTTPVRIIQDAKGARHCFCWSERWGPYVSTPHGNPTDGQPGPRSPFWRAVILWNRQGREFDGLVARWHEPRPEVLRILAGRNVEVVEDGEDPEFSKTVILKGDIIQSVPISLANHCEI